MIYIHVTFQRVINQKIARQRGKKRARETESERQERKRELINRLVETCL